MPHAAHIVPHTLQQAQLATHLRGAGGAPAT